MNQSITVSDLKKKIISVKAVAAAAKLGFDTDCAVMTLSNVLRNFLENFKPDGKIPVIDLVETFKGSHKIVEDLRAAAYIEANGNPEKHLYILNEKIATDSRLTEYAAKEKELMNTKVDIEFTPVLFDIEIVEMLQKYLHRDEKEYVFDMQLVFPPVVEVEYMGATFKRSPLAEFIELISEGFFIRVDKAESPANVLKNKVKNLNSANNG